MHLLISRELGEHFDFFFFVVPPEIETEMGSHIPPTGPTPLSLQPQPSSGFAFESSGISRPDWWMRPSVRMEWKVLLKASIMA